MATRSAIGVKRDNGTIEAIYCHWDGYPEHNGKLLVEHYPAPEKIEELLSMGDISALGEDIAKTVFYTRDRREPLRPAQKVKNVKRAFAKFDIEWLYVFEDGVWQCYHWERGAYDLNNILEDTRLTRKTRNIKGKGTKIFRREE